MRPSASNVTPAEAGERGRPGMIVSDNGLIAVSDNDLPAILQALDLSRMREQELEQARHAGFEHAPFLAHRQEMGIGIETPGAEADLPCHCDPSLCAPGPRRKNGSEPGFIVRRANGANMRRIAA